MGGTRAEDIRGTVGACWMLLEGNLERSRQAEMVAVDVSVEGCRGGTWQEAWRRSREQIYGCSEGAAGCRGG